LVLQVGAVSDETVKLRDSTGNYRPALSPETTPYMKKKESI
jgi:hypothetical protein